MKFLVNDLQSSVFDDTLELVGPLERHLHLTNLHPTTSALLSLPCLKAKIRFTFPLQGKVLSVTPSLTTLVRIQTLSFIDTRTKKN